jgi:hypothetical protein
MNQSMVVAFVQVKSVAFYFGGHCFFGNLIVFVVNFASFIAQHDRFVVEVLILSLGVVFFI